MNLLSGVLDMVLRYTSLHPQGKQLLRSVLTMPCIFWVSIQWQTIRSAKGRLKEVPIPLTERFSRFSNVPATLLHIGLLSVDLSDEELRGAAYDLLGSVCTYLNYDKSPIVASKGLSAFTRLAVF
jgi:hypothetical protein